MTRLSIFALALVAAVAGPAAADPARPAKPPAGDDVHITVTAGRGRLGFAAIQISPALRHHFGAPDDRGVLVDQVRSGSPAEKAGLRVGDVLLEADGSPTTAAADVLDAIQDRKQGEQVPLVVMRGGNRVTLQATLDDNPGPRFDKKFDGLERFEGFENFGGFDRDAIQELRKRMDELERRFRQRQTQQPARPPTKI